MQGSAVQQGVPCTHAAVESGAQLKFIHSSSAALIPSNVARLLNVVQ
jgi:hypothetical protein